MSFDERIMQIRREHEARCELLGSGGANLELYTALAREEAAHEELCLTWWAALMARAADALTRLRSVEAERDQLRLLVYEPK